MPRFAQLTISPACIPSMPLESLLALYSGMGYTRFEAFTSWVQSAFDWTEPPESYLERLDRYGMRVTSLHLPKVRMDRPDTLEDAVRAAQFADGLGASAVIFKAETAADYAAMGRRFLDRLDEEQIRAIPVLTNHSGTAISSIDDYRNVCQAIGDKRMKTLLEVGHFHAVGVAWREGYDFLGDSIRLVHLKDMIGPESVPYGTGEIDLPGLFAQLDAIGYTGQYVIEMDRKTPEDAQRYLREAVAYFRTYFH